MGVLRVHGLEKSFGAENLFHGVCFEIARGEKVGLVGANGAGKTTLMRCLLGKAEYDAGTVAFEHADTVGYVEQQAQFGDGTLYDEFLAAFQDILDLGECKKMLEREISQSANEERLAAYGKIVERFEQLGGYDYESRIRRIAFGLGFTESDFGKNAKHFSGGQRTRICLAKALLREPDFLFLDEPTNHLDIKMMEWLENFLRDYSGGVLMISHDRFFLDCVATRILEIENREVTSYHGNYTEYLRVKADRRAALQSAYEKQQAYIQKTEEYIRRYKAGIKAKQARGRQSQLNRMKRIVLPPGAAALHGFAFPAPAECAERVAEIEDVSMSFGAHRVFSHLSLLIRRGDGMAVVGPNGAGKTTLLRILLGELESPTGRVKIGNRVRIGYFSQHHEGLHPENTILDEIVYAYGMDEDRARKCLGAFLFHGDEVFRRIGELSGGEQSRVAFLKLMLDGANFLILDEPTNHLDIPAKEAMEAALMAFPGTFLAVSHDRYFLDRVANCILELENGILTEYDGGYSDYRAKKEMIGGEAGAAHERETAKNGKVEKPKQADTASMGAEKARKAKASPLIVVSEAKREELIQRAEAEIAMAEAELKGLEYEMNRMEVQSDAAKSAKIAEEYAAKEKEIAERYARWERLMEA